MKIKRFNETYKLDDDGNISEETAKIVISHYIDNIDNGGTLQDSFDLYCKEDLEEDLRRVVFSEIRSFNNILADSIQKLYVTDDDYLRRDKYKFNL